MDWLYGEGMTLTAEDIAVDQLKHDEGLRLTPYQCTAGKLTIGYGRNLEDVGITEAEAELFLQHDVSVAKRVARLTVGNDVWHSLSSTRQAVLINMAFNLGALGLSRFVKTLEAIRCGDYSVAADEMLDSAWARQVGRRAERLASIMLEG